MKLITNGLQIIGKRYLQWQLLLKAGCSRNYGDFNHFLPSKQNYFRSNLLPRQAFKRTSNNVRQIQTSNINKVPKTPDLIYVPHVLRWLKTKFRLKYLQKTWDPEFSEGAFIYGTTRAICKITDIIHKDTLENLEGLLTDSARTKLQEDVKSKVTKTQKKIIKLRPGDIKILVPISVNLKKEGFTKRCDVALRSLALKWFEDKGVLKLVLVALQTEFMRDYTHGTNSEWIISMFEILECAMLKESTTTRL